MAGLFALVAGFGIGAVSPLQGIFADAVFDRSELGAMMGYLALVFGLTGAIGPAIAGILAEATGNRWWALVIAAGSGIAAVAFMRFTDAGVKV
jgi:MFS family permease